MERVLCESPEDYKLREVADVLLAVMTSEYYEYKGNNGKQYAALKLNCIRVDGHTLSITLNRTLDKSTQLLNGGKKVWNAGDFISVKSELASKDKSIYESDGIWYIDQVDKVYYGNLVIESSKEAFMTAVEMYKIFNS